VVEAATRVVLLRKPTTAVTRSTVTTGPGERHRATHDATTDHRAEHADTDELDGPVPHRAAHPAGLCRVRRRWCVRVWRRAGLSLRRRRLLVDHGLFGRDGLGLGRLGSGGMGNGRGLGRWRGATTFRLRERLGVLRIGHIPSITAVAVPELCPTCR
jgi:hypothetical protein